MLSACAAEQLLAAAADMLVPGTTAHRSESAIAFLQHHWDELQFADRVDAIRKLLTVVASAIEPRDQAVVHLTFSGSSLSTASIEPLLQRWAVTHEPPVATLIGIALEAHAQLRIARSIGLRTFVGHELLVAYRVKADENDAIRDLFRLARHAVMHGPIPVGARFAGVRGVVHIGPSKAHALGDYTVTRVD